MFPVVSAHIKRHDGVFERPFDARKVDNQGLPDFVSFNEFDHSTFGASVPAATADKGKHKKHKSASHKEKKRARSSTSEKQKKHKKHKSNKAASSSSSSSSSSSTPDVLIHRCVGKMVVSLARASYPASYASPSTLKSVQRKTGSKVLEDWQSKDRTGVKIKQWLEENEKRKEKIKELIKKYLDMYGKTAETTKTDAAAAATSSAAATASNGRGRSSDAAAASSTSQS